MKTKEEVKNYLDKLEKSLYFLQNNNKNYK